MFIIYFYIIMRYLIVLGLIVSALLFLIKTIKNKKSLLLIGVIVPVFVIGFMFSYGTIRKPAVDIEDLCVNFDNLYDNDIIDCSSFYAAFLQLTEDDANESIKYIQAEKKILSGTIDNVKYFATYMYSDMLDFKNLYTYCGNYEGQILLVKGNQTIEVDYIIRTSQKDPRAIFYSFKPSEIKISDYANQ